LTLLGVVDVVYPVERADVERARRLLRTTPRLSARNAVHLAVMQARDIGRILSFDSAFDGIPGVIRLA
jgi:predicted nucleic acid-binding protein